MPKDYTELGKSILRRFGHAQAERGTWDTNLQDIRDLVRCDTADFNRSRTPGVKRYDNVFDGTAVNACEEFACGLHSYLSAPSERWFELGVTGKDKELIRQDHEAKAWLDMVADIIYDVFSDSRTGFNTALSESYLDLGAFGSAAPECEWNTEKRHIVFKTESLAEFFFEENAAGKINALFRYYEQTGEQILEEFKDDGLLQNTKIWRELIRPNCAYQRFKVIRYIFPRNNSKLYQMVEASEKPWASVTIIEKTGEVIRVSGYDSFPFAVSRWVKISGEVYGRSPAMKAMPDILSLQTMEKTMLKAGQKAVDPPLVLDDDSVIEPLSQAPGSVIWKEPGSEMPQQLEHKGNLAWGLEMTTQKREAIEKAFHINWFRRFRKNREQSAFEVADDRDEMLRMLAPMLGRQQTELLGPLIERVYLLLHLHGFIPPAPQILQKRQLTIIYISPAARAQQAVKADRLGRFMADIAPLAQTDPTVMDEIDGSKVVKVYAEARGVPQSVFRTKAEVAALREQRNQQQQMAAAAQIAEPASKALLNVAQATEATGGGLPGGPIG